MELVRTNNPTFVRGLRTVGKRLWAEPHSSQTEFVFSQCQNINSALDVERVERAFVISSVSLILGSQSSSSICFLGEGYFEVPLPDHKGIWVRMLNLSVVISAPYIEIVKAV